MAKASRTGSFILRQKMTNSGRPPPQGIFFLRALLVWARSLASPRRSVWVLVVFCFLLLAVSGRSLVPAVLHDFFVSFAPRLGPVAFFCVSVVCFSVVFLFSGPCVGVCFSSLILSTCGLWSQDDKIKLEKYTSVQMHSDVFLQGFQDRDHPSKCADAD